MRGLTWTRDAGGGYPAVARYRALAAECRTVVGPDIALSYAADWSEYSGHRPAGGSGDVIFHLDPLWADEAITYVGIDWYPPLGDWREGDGGIDGEAFEGADDPDYLADQVAGGDGFDWFYASDADREAQARTPIVDTAYGEHWAFRAKDLIGWWSHAHHDRPDGVRVATPTAWVPGMKPIRLTEFGCAAVDRGGNAPNLFQDPKSSESFLPPFSTGERDERMQRRAIEAVLTHFEAPGNNPGSAVYGGPMVEAADVWCWDARPYPAFPALQEVWADAGAWGSGHWLNGRLGGEANSLLAAILRRGGVEDFHIGAASGTVAGYVIDRPMRTRDALEPLLQAFDMDAGERGGRVSLRGGEGASGLLALADLAVTEERAGPVRTRSLEALPGTARIRFMDEGADYQTGATVVRGDGEGGGVDADLPAVCGVGLAKALARRLLKGEGEDRLALALGPLDALRLEAGDTVAIEGEAGAWLVERAVLDETPTAVLARRTDQDVATEPVVWRTEPGVETAGAPFVRLLDLPPLPGAETDDRLIAAVACDPWRPMTVHAGENADTLTARGTVGSPATVGRLMQPLAPGVLHRWDETNAVVAQLEGGAPASLSESAVLGGANLIAVETAEGWEIVQYRQATLLGVGAWRLSGLLRGQQGTEREMSAGGLEGGLVVLLDPKGGRFDTAPGERGLTRIARVGPSGRAPGGSGFAGMTFTPMRLQARPWSPVLGVAEEGGGRRLWWIPRTRIGDVWDLEPAEVDPRRFRVRILSGEVERRAFEVEGTSMLYAAEELSADFPGAIAPDAAVAVAQYGPGFGWGAEAQASLIV